MNLPRFKYIADPVRSDIVLEAELGKLSDGEGDQDVCQCCGSSFKMICFLPFSSDSLVNDSSKDVEYLCPWCIADGRAYSKFKRYFSDPQPLLKAGVCKDAVAEVCERTPGIRPLHFSGTIWKVCCKDACCYHGELTIGEFKRLSKDVRSSISSQNRMTLEGLEAHIEKTVESYTEAKCEFSDLSTIHEFRCLHCNKVYFELDRDFNPDYERKTFLREYRYRILLACIVIGILLLLKIMELQNKLSNPTQGVTPI